MTIRNFFAGLCLCVQPGDMTDDVWEKRLRMQQQADSGIARKAKKAEKAKLGKIVARKEHLALYGIAPARPANALRTQSDSVLVGSGRRLPLGERRGSPPMELSLPAPAFARVRETWPETAKMPSPPLPSPSFVQRKPTSPLAKEPQLPLSPSPSPEERADLPTPLPPPPRPASRRALPSSRSTRSVNRLSMPADVGDYLSKGY